MWLYWITFIIRRFWHVQLACVFGNASEPKHKCFLTLDSLTVFYVGHFNLGNKYTEIALTPCIFHFLFQLFNFLSFFFCFVNFLLFLSEHRIGILELNRTFQLCKCKKFLCTIAICKDLYSCQWEKLLLDKSILNCGALGNSCSLFLFYFSCITIRKKVLCSWSCKFLYLQPVFKKVTL